MEDATITGYQIPNIIIEEIPNSGNDESSQYHLTELFNVPTESTSITANSQNPIEAYRDHKISPPLTDVAAYEMRELLEKWDFVFLYEIFLEERIDRVALMHMKMEYLLRLNSMSKIGLGYIIKFEQQLKIWQSSLLNPTECCIKEATNIDDTHYKLRVEPDYNDDVDLNLNEILNATTRGRAIIKHYAQHNTLNDGCRAILLDIINSFLIQQKIKVTTSLARILSNQIIKKFATEELGTYFVKQQGKRVVSKIYSKYFNSLRTMKDCGLMEKKSYISSSLQNKFLRTTVALDFEPELDIDVNLNCINEDNCSFGELEHHWIATKTYRCKQLAEIIQHSEGSTNDVFGKWPHYKKPLGYKLMDIDFEVIFGRKYFIQQFESSRSKLIKIMQEKIKDAANKKIVENLISNRSLSQNDKNTTILYLLHTIVPPVSREMSDIPSTSKQACMKYTIRDSQNSIFLIGETVTEIEEKIEIKLKLNLPIQPFVIVQGTLENPTNFVVFFDGCRYQFNCILQALDICFKIYMLFNLQYPQSSILVWNFIQLYYYNIITTFDRQHTFINLIIKKLKD